LGKGPGFNNKPDPNVRVEVDGKVFTRGPRGGLLCPSAEAKVTPLNNEATGLHRKNGFHPSSGPGLVNEQPWHSMAAYMLLAGRTNSEIAAAAGVSTQQVTVLRSQLWFQQKLAILANNDGDEIMAAFKSHALAAVERIAAIAESGESERNRLTANQLIVEQACGKAVQKTLNVHASALSGLSPQEEYERTQEELRLLRAARGSVPT
jgi:hypothetical protein